MTIADLRRLKGFIVSFTEVESDEGFVIDQNDELIEWSVMYVEYVEGEQKGV